MAGAVALLGWGLGVLASTPVRWHWEPAEGCPDETTVVAHGQALLDPRATDEPVDAFGHITGGPGAYALDLRVEVGTRRERRRLQASDCELLTRAGVLVVAITVDALATANAVATADMPAPTLPSVEAPPPELPSAPPQPVSPVPPTDAIARPQPRSSPEARTTALRLGLGAGLGWGLAPSGTPGLEGIIGVELGRLRLEAAGYHWFAQPAPLSADTGTESAVSGGWLHGCIAWSWTAVGIPLCAGVDLAAMHGRGIGSRVQSQDVRDLWVAVSAGPGLELRLTRRFAVNARLEPFFAVRRPAMFLVVDGQPQETFRMPTFGLRVMVGPFFRLGSKETDPGGAR